MKKSLLLLSAIFLSGLIYAEIVPEKNAEKVAKSYFYQAFNNLENIEKTAWDDIVLQCIVNAEKDKNAAYYVFNINKDNGYILISSHYSIPPVLAYSLKAGFNFDDIAPGQQLFLDHFTESVEYAFENDIEQTEKVSKKWNYYLDYKPEQKFKQKTTVEPLLYSIEWNQRWPYNAMCPEDSDAFGGRVPVGCVATAMLQVMKYYNWPQTGVGSKSHTHWNNGGYGNYSVNFAQQNYDWTNVPNKGSSNYNEELAKLNLHAGIAVEMRWGPTSSGSIMYNILPALRDHFKYSSAITYYEKVNNTETAWKNHIRAQIDSKKPIVYAGRTAEGAGHAWNCDGYQGDDHFHMNWGWGGSGNGFYTLDDLVSTATSGGSESNFIYDQRIISNIYPAGTYPEFCGGTKTITGAEGSFEDGSSTDNYNAVTNCTYVINPECGAVINLDFDRFDLATGDKVEIFDGLQNSNILIETFNSSNIPDGTITAGHGAMTIKFVSSGNPTASGWGVSYNVNYCRTNILYTDPSGSFDDGSGICEYEKSTVCTWIIEPEEANYVIIDFEEFDLASGADFVKVFKNSMSGANTIATFTAANLPGEAVYVDAGVAIIQFFADSGDVGQGWKINYESGVTEIEESDFISNLVIVPNPGNNNSEIHINIEKNNITNFSVYDLLGKKIDTKTLSLKAGKNNLKINDVVNKELKNGVYFINIEINNNIFTEKFIIVE